MIDIPATVAPEDFVSAGNSAAARPQLSNADIRAEVAVERQVLIDDSHNKENKEEEELQATMVCKGNH